jgi:hypothetical protein
MSVSFGEHATAFSHIGWQHTLVIVPPKSKLKKWSANSLGAVYLNRGENMPGGVFRTLHVTGYAGDGCHARIVFEDIEDGVAQQGVIETFNYPNYAPHASFKGWLSLSLLEELPDVNRIVPPLAIRR